MPARSFGEPKRYHLLTDNTTTVASTNKARVRDPEIAKLQHRAEGWRHKTAVFLTAGHIPKNDMDSLHTVDARGRKRSKLWDRSLPRTVLAAILQDLRVLKSVQL